MISEWNKCRFCKWNYDTGCEALCTDHDEYKPDANMLIEKAEEKGISVMDVIALIEAEDDRGW